MKPAGTRVRAEVLGPSDRSVIFATPRRAALPLSGGPAGVLLLAAGPVSIEAQQRSIYTALESDSRLSTLKAAVDAAGLADALTNPTLEYTLFAPTNEVA